MKRLYWLIIPLAIIVFVILYKMDVIANFKGESKTAVTEPKDKDSDSYFSYSLVSDIPTNHTWELKFSKELDAKTVSKSNVYVKDKDKNEVKVKSEVSQDGKTLQISPPKDGYKEGTRYTIFVEKGLQYKDGSRDEQAAKMPFVTTRKDNEKLELKKNLVQLKADAIKSQQGNQIVVDKAAVDKPIKKQTPLIIPTNDQYEPEQAVLVDTIKEEGSTYVITYKEANIKDIVDVIDIYKVLKINDGIVVPDKKLQGIEITKTNSNGVVRANVEDKKQDFLVQAPLDLSEHLKPHELQTPDIQPEQVNTSGDTPNAQSLGLGKEIVFSNPALNQSSSPLAESMKSKPKFEWNKETEINNRGESSIEVDGLNITNPIGFKIKFNNFTIPKDNQNFVMDGEITIDPDLLFDVDYSWGRIKRINIGQKITTVESGKLSIIPKDKNSNFANMEIKQHIFDVYFPIFTPIKGKLEFYLYMSWDYKRMQPVVKIKAEQSAKAGVYVEKDDIEPYDGFDHEEDVMLSGQASFENREGVGAEVSANLFKAPLAGVEANTGLYVEAKATAGVQIGDDTQAATCLKAEVGPFINSKANIYLFSDDKKWSYEILDKKFAARELGSSCTELTSIELDTDYLNYNSSTETLKLDSDEERTLKVMGVYSDKFELKKDKVDLLEDSKKKKNVKFKVEDSTVATITADGKIKAGQNPNSGETKVNITYTENKKEHKMSFTVKLSELAGKTKIPKTNSEILDYEKTFNELFNGIRKTVFIQSAELTAPLPDFSTITGKVSQYATDSYMNSKLKEYYQQSRGWMHGYPIPYEGLADTCSKKGNSVTCKLIELNDEDGSRIYDATMVKQNGKWLIDKVDYKELHEITYKQAARSLEQQGYKVNYYLRSGPSKLRPNGIDYTFEVVTPQGQTKEFDFPSTMQ